MRVIAVALAASLAPMLIGCSAAERAIGDLRAYVAGDPSPTAPSDAGSRADAAGRAEGERAVAGGEAPASARSGAAAWSYAGATGAEHWGALDPAWRACAEGRAQSPIDLTSAAEADLPPIELHYRPGPAVFENDGGTIVAAAPPGGWALFDGARYELLEVRFRTPAEHPIGGTRAPMEAQFHHRDLHGRIAILAVLVQEGRRNPAFAALRDYAPAEPGLAMPEATTFDPASLLPERLDRVRYSGSLTTPPCTEGVAWRVLLQPIQASSGALAVMRDIMGSNARPLQPLAGRRPLYDRSRRPSSP